MSPSNRIQLVIFDWAGTTVDHGCFAPVAAFIDALAAHGVELAVGEARQPMGLHKRDHIRALLAIPAVAERWRIAHRRDWNESDIQRIYETFLPLQAETAPRHSELVPGILECTATLRERGVKIGTTTGYPREIAEPVIAAARRQGYDPDHNVCADEVPAGRPAPWMIHENMQALDVYPARCIVKVGDTVPDIEEGLNASVWSVGVTRTGSEVGCTADEFEELPESEKKARQDQAGRKLTVAGAHHVITTVTELGDLLPELEARLERGDAP